jgi:outer membrane protein assembly factor BamB
MSLENGELLEGSDIPSFDESTVARDVCHCASAQRVFALDSLTLNETWEYAREGERYHGLARSGDRVYVSVTQVSAGADDPQGVLVLDASTGEYVGHLLRPCLPTIHGLCATGGLVIVFTEQIEGVIGSDRMGEYALALGSHPGGGNRDTLSMLALAEGGSSDSPPAWFRILETTPVGDIPEVSVSSDNGKLYVERGAMLEALDALSGRPLGDWTVPGLDMKIGWTVAAGAGLLAEETRVSLFELPA